MTGREKLPNSYYAATVAGIISIFLWASNIAFSKSVMEKEGNLLASCYMYIYSAAFLAILILIFSRRSFMMQGRSNRIFRFKSGIFFIMNNVLLLLAIGMARKNEELVIVTLLNYTWPIMIYITGIPVLKLKIPARILLPGILLSFTGISLALVQGYDQEEIGKIFRAGNDNILAYSLAFLTSVSWALYSNLTSKYRAQDDLTALPAVFLVSGLIFLCGLGFKGQITSFDYLAPLKNPELAFMIIGPTSLGYLGWYFAIKKGNGNLVTSLSFFIPLFSLLIIHFRFNIPITLLFWISVVLLISGSYLCYRSFRRI